MPPQKTKHRSVYNNLEVHYRKTQLTQNLISGHARHTNPRPEDLEIRCKKESSRKHIR